MGFEALPDDIESFFSTGELPASLQAASTPPVETPDPNAGAAAASEAANSSAAATDAGNADAGTATAQPAATPAANTPDYSAAIAAQQAKLDALMKQMTDMQAAEKAKLEEANKPVAPDPEKDPLGYLTYQIQQVGDQVKAMQTAQQQSAQQTEQKTAQQQFQEAIVGMVEEYKKTQPDYMDAYKYLIDLRTDDFRTRGMSQSEIQQALAAEEGNILQNAIRQQKNPAELAYTLAKRYGYVQKAASSEPPEKQAASKLDAIKKGMETTGVDRAAPPASYSTDSVKEMNGKQLQDAVENHWHEMFGKSSSKDIF